MTRRNTGPDAATCALVDGRAQGMCERCGEHRGEQRHHRKPRGAGGSRVVSINYASNLLVLCSRCHREVESERRVAYGDGFLVPRPQDPAQWPVKHARLGWVFLRDDGGWDPAPVETHPRGCAVWTSNDDPCDCNTEPPEVPRG